MATNDRIIEAAARTARYLLTTAPFLRTYLHTQMASAGIPPTDGAYNAFLDAVLAALVAERAAERTASAVALTRKGGRA